ELNTSIPLALRVGEPYRRGPTACSKGGRTFAGRSMSKSKRKCICESEFCKNHGNGGKVRVPRWRRQQFQEALRLENGLTQTDPRVWLGHFAADDVKASKQGRGAGGTEMTVRLGEGALPTQ
ncbi:unnamed protein product, partial [Pylaiella littoralis]